MQNIYQAIFWFIMAAVALTFNKMSKLKPDYEWLDGAWFGASLALAIIYVLPIIKAAWNAVPM